MSVVAEVVERTGSGAVLDVEAVRRDFPILHQQVRGGALAYLDNGATTQKPIQVIDAVSSYYSRDNANVHRGVHELSRRATDAYEGARETVREFINAADAREIVFVRGTTEAINLVAHSYARPRMKPGDEIIVTEMEHHSNIVPWQMVAQQTGAVIRVAPVTDSGEVDFEAFEFLFNARTRLLAVTHVSNALGTVNPLQEMIRTARRHDAAVVVDGAQAVAHDTVDVRALDCDFYAFSGHKMYGPTGIGALYGKLEYLESMDPYQGGGEMILMVTFEKATYAKPPARFEAGTPNIAGAIGMAAAIDYVRGYGLKTIRAYERELLDYAQKRAAAIDGLRIIGTAPDKAGILSFVFDDVHAHDVGTIMDSEGLAIRAGHLCAMPVMKRFGIAATARASFGMYNTREEVDRLIRGMHKVLEVMGR
ncbi:MAG: cysteine desulfurase [Pseudomonadota bacterium]|nr:cysteine desulfurase [Pseudomonadota bacterium]